MKRVKKNAPQKQNKQENKTKQWKTRRAKKEYQKSCKSSQFTRLLEQCKVYSNQKLSKEHPPTSITYIGMGAANLALAYKITGQKQYLDEAKRWIFTAVNYDVWGYGFLVDVDLSASW